MKPNELVEEWRLRVNRMQHAHFIAARMFYRRHFWLGVPAIIFSTIIGTTIFKSLATTTDGYIKIIIGCMSVITASLTALQTFLKNSEQSEKHQIAGAKFANLKHRIELLSSLPPNNEAELKLELTKIEDRWAKVREESPTLPPRVYEKVEKSIK